MIAGPPVHGESGTEDGSAAARFSSETGMRALWCLEAHRERIRSQSGHRCAHLGVMWVAIVHDGGRRLTDAAEVVELH